MNIKFNSKIKMHIFIAYLIMTFLISLKININKEIIIFGLGLNIVMLIMIFFAKEGRSLSPPKTTFPIEISILSLITITLYKKFIKKLLKIDLNFSLEEYTIIFIDLSGDFLLAVLIIFIYIYGMILAFEIEKKIEQTNLKFFKYFSDIIVLILVVIIVFIISNLLNDIYIYLVLFSGIFTLSILFFKTFEKYTYFFLWFISFIMFSTYYENQIFYKNLKNNKELNIFYKQIGNNQIFYNSTTKTFSIKNL